MSVSAKLFKIKRGFESVIDFFKNFFISIGLFFKKIFSHPRTYRAGVKIGRAKRKILGNFRENAANWKRRTFDDHGFNIGEEDI